MTRATRINRADVAASASSTVNAPLVERPADDHAGQRAAADVERQRARAGGRAMPTPPQAIDVELGRRPSSSRVAARGRARRAVPSTAISVTTSAATPASANRASTSSSVRPDALGPPAHRDLAAPRRRGPTATGRASGRRRRSTSAGSLERGGAEHDPGHAGVEQRLGRRRVAHAAAGLHRARRPTRGDRGDHRPVRPARRCGRRRGRRRGSTARRRRRTRGPGPTGSSP